MSCLVSCWLDAGSAGSWHIIFICPAQCKSIPSAGECTRTAYRRDQGAAQGLRRGPAEAAVLSGEAPEMEEPVLHGDVGDPGGAVARPVQVAMRQVQPVDAEQFVQALG